MSEWIPVSERVPEEGDFVLGYQLHGSITDCYPIIFFDDDVVHHVNEWAEHPNAVVTHWMYLPIPPDQIEIDEQKKESE